MSKLYDLYLEKKKENSDYLYLFKSGTFYIFIDEDAKFISSITTLILTNLTKEKLKCGFPKNSFDKYMAIFNNLELNVQVIEELHGKKSYENIINKIKEINIDVLRPIDAFNIIVKLKGELDE